jgi:hypothetical protein
MHRLSLPLVAARIDARANRRGSPRSLANGFVGLANGFVGSVAKHAMAPGSTPFIIAIGETQDARL